MKAVIVRAFGEPAVLRLEQVPDPVCGPGQVLVRLRAAGVNPVETYVRSGGYARLPALPYIPGSDGAGEVVAVGADVADFQPGDRVYVAGAPAYAEQVAAPRDTVWPLPDHVGFEEGAAVGVPYRTAYMAVHQVGAARPGDWVLVHGASGAVGTAAVQLAAAHGCRVVGTAGTDRGRELVREQGARTATAHGAVEQAMAATGARGFDLIVEMLANANLGVDLQMLAPGGRVAVVGSRGRVEIDPRDVMSRSASIVGVMGMSADERRRIHLALDAGLRQRTLRPVVGRRFPLADAAAAHTAVLEPGALGKIVLTIP